MGEVKELSSPNKTLCDYDGSLPADLRKRVRQLRRAVGAKLRKIRLDRTARGFHLILEWGRSFSPIEIIAMQAILGSDPMRECLNLARIQGMPEHGPELRYWNILYARKHELSYAVSD